MIGALKQLAEQILCDFDGLKDLAVRKLQEKLVGSDDNSQMPPGRLAARQSVFDCEPVCSKSRKGEAVRCRGDCADLLFAHE